MRNLITGLGGFAGSHLADWLLSQGEEVIGLSTQSIKTNNYTKYNKQGIIFWGIYVGALYSNQLSKIIQTRIY